MRCVKQQKPLYLTSNLNAISRSCLVYLIRRVNLRFKEIEELNKELKINTILRTITSAEHRRLMTFDSILLNLTSEETMIVEA